MEEVTGMNVYARQMRHLSLSNIYF